MMGAGDPDGDEAPCQLAAQSGGQADVGTVGPGVISTVAEMILELAGLGLPQGWGPTPMGGGACHKGIKLVPLPGYRIRCSQGEEPDGRSRAFSGLGWRNVG